MASLSVDVMAGSVSIGLCRSGGNHGGTLGKVTGIWDTLILQIS